MTRTNLLLGSDELIEIASGVPTGGRDEKFALRLELFNSLSSSFISYRERYDVVVMTLPFQLARMLTLFYMLYVKFFRFVACGLLHDALCGFAARPGSLPC